MSRRRIVRGQRTHRWSTALWILVVAVVLTRSGLIFSRAATPRIPTLGNAGALAFLTDGCPVETAKYDVLIDRTKVTATQGTVDLVINMSCGVQGTSDIRWALVLGGAMAGGTDAVVADNDAHHSNDARNLVLRPPPEHDYFEGQDDLSPVVMAAGIDQTNIIGDMNLTFTLTNASLGQRSGARVAIAAPSVETVFSSEEFRVPADWFKPNQDVSPASQDVSVHHTPKPEITATAGRLITDERVEFSSPSLADPGILMWRGKGVSVSALIADTNAEQREQQKLFWAGILVGLAASLFIWLVELILEALGILPD